MGLQGERRSPLRLNVPGLRLGRGDGQGAVERLAAIDAALGRPGAAHRLPVTTPAGGMKCRGNSLPPPASPACPSKRDDL